MIATILSGPAKALTLFVVSIVTAAGGLAARLPSLPFLPVSVTIEHGQQIDALIARLGSSDAHERAMAACEIGRMRGSRDLNAALDPLVALLGDGAPVEPRLCRNRGYWRGNDEESSPGREAAIALKRLGDAALDPVREALHSDNPTARRNAAFALGLLENRQAIDALAAALGDELAEVREQAAWALGMIGESSAVEALIRALDDEDPGVRKQAIWALMQCVDASDPDLDYAGLAEKLRKVLRGG